MKTQHHSPRDAEGTTSVVERDDSALARLRDWLGQSARGVAIQDVVVGRRFCAVLLDDDALGIANISPDGCGVPRSGIWNHVPHPGTPVGNVLSSWQSHGRAAIGLATANALANRSVREGGRWDERRIGGDLLEGIDLRPDDHVGMVGCFHPLVDSIRQRVKRLTIFERTARLESGLLSESQAPEVLPECSVALITATALINGTISALLHSAADCREVVILGPSTPLVPEIFTGSAHVTLLSGAVPTDRAGLLCAVIAGGGTRDFRPFTAKVNIRVSPSRGPVRGEKR